MKKSERGSSFRPACSAFLFAFLLLSACGSGGGGGGGSNPGGGSPPPPQTFDLTLVKGGSGKGSITSTPSGIDCGATCTASYAGGTSVTLVAAPDTGSLFQGWSGECGGTANCVVTIDAAKSVTATFNPPPPTTSGGLATINTGKTIFAFIPSGSGVLIVPLAGEGASKPKVDQVESKTSATTTLSFNVDSCAADGVDLKVVCVGFLSSKVAILDLKDFITSGTTPTFIEFDSGNKVSSSFSGGGCLNCGVIADPGDHRFIVSSGDGYRVYDYTGASLKSYLSNPTANPPVDLATENFGYDPIKNLIISPEYETTNNFIWVVDLNKDKVYRWTKRMVPASVDSTNGLPEISKNFIADAAAIDPVTGIVTVGDEFTPTLLEIDLSSSAFDDAAGTLTAPYSTKALDTPVPFLLTTGMAVEPSSHFLFLEAEFLDVMGLVILPVSSGSGSPVIDEYTTAVIPSPAATCTGISSWNNVGDPHGLALFTSVVDGKPMGLLINGSKNCAAVVDLTAFRSSPKQTGTNQVDPTYDLLANKVISFVSLQ